MIKLHSSGIAPDYTEHGSVTTDCKTVGEFMTEAAAIFGRNLTIYVDSCRYEFSDNPKMKVADYTPIDEVTYASSPGRMTFVVRTNPKPKTVRKSGWVNIFKVKESKPFPAGFIYEDKKLCETDEAYIYCNESFVAFARIEWEEVVND